MLIPDDLHNSPHRAQPIYIGALLNSSQKINTRVVPPVKDAHGVFELPCFLKVKVTEDLFKKLDLMGEDC